MKRALLGLALAALLPVSAQAADGGLSYSYVEGNYQSSNWGDGDFDGFGFGGSVGFHQNWYVSGSYRNLDLDENDLDVGLDETVLNIGWHHAVSDKADFLAELGWVNYGADIEGDEGDSDGFRVAAGFRGMLAPRFEGSIKATYTDVSDLDNEFGIGVGGVFHIYETWGITGGYEHTSLLDEGMDTWSVGVPASF
jgi:hypothetical protein